MKVCDLTQFYAPRSGGVKRYLEEKRRWIARHRPNDEHLLIVPGGLNGRTREGNTTIYEIASPLMPRSGGYRALLNLRAVGEIIEREKPNIIESADPYQLGWFVANISRMWKIPAVAFYHSHLPELPGLARFRALTRSYVAQLYNRFACTIVASATLANDLRDYGVSNVTVVELGIDPTVFHPRPNGSVNERVKLLYVGRLAAEKNVQLLFEAWQRLPRECFELLVIGDGPLRDAIPTDIRHINYCADREELARYYRAADLFVHPGVQETFGLAAIEAQACGTPVLAFQGTRMDAVICHDQSGWPNERTAAALAEGIVRMTQLPLRQMGRIASERVRERFAWPATFDRLFCLYADVCRKYQRT